MTAPPTACCRPMFVVMSFEDVGLVVGQPGNLSGQLQGIRQPRLTTLKLSWLFFLLHDGGFVCWIFFTGNETGMF